MNSPVWLSLKDEISASLESAYPEEGCGLLLERDGSWTWRECTNLADTLHAHDPVLYPRTARTSYVIDPVDILDAVWEGETIRLIVHSHADSAPEFSSEDVRKALMGSAKEGFVPSYPDVDYLVVSVESGVVGDARIFQFVDGVFEGRDVRLG